MGLCQDLVMSYKSASDTNATDAHTWDCENAMSYLNGWKEITPHTSRFFPQLTPLPRLTLRHQTLKEEVFKIHNHLLSHRNIDNPEHQ